MIGVILAQATTTTTAAAAGGAAAVPAVVDPITVNYGNGLPASFVLGFVLLDIAIILIVARLVGKLALRIGQPRVVGEIVAGILLGPSLLGATVYTWKKPWDVLQCDVTRAWVGAGSKAIDPATGLAKKPTLPSITECFFPGQARGVLSILGQVALIFFMFLVGLELNYAILKGRIKGIVTVALGVVAIPVVFGFLLNPVLHDKKFATGAVNAETGKFVFSGTSAGFALFIGAMLAVTAFPVMARILQEKGLTTSLMGAVGIAAAAIVTILMFLLVGVADGVSKDKSGGQLSRIFIGTAIYLVVMFVVVKPLLARTIGKNFEAKGFNGEMFAVLIIVAFASAYAADRIGINVIVGSFIAGAILPAREGLFKAMSGRLSELTGAILLPIFLAFSGLNTDFTKLGWSWLPGLGLFLLAAIVGKWLGGAVAARASGMSWAEGNVLGILMNCRGLLVLVVALLAKQGGFITDQMQVGGVLVALVTTAMTGPLFDKFLPAANAAAAASASGGAKGKTVAEEINI
jgi:Kef-type K+ transport system membrane component KefB